MKIAVLSPSPVPFTLGGAEKLWQGLYEYINKHTKHQCELIKLPTRENSFWDIIDSYYTFYSLDLSHFDLVISGKYPAWINPHKNHHLYMLHPLRGLYDLYDVKLFKDEPELISFSEDMQLNDFFRYLFELKEKGLEVDFPSSTSKKVIQFLDKKAQENIKYFSAISKTVSKRKDYFFTTKDVEVIYPPTVLKDLKSISYDYFFTASRLDKPKRIDLIIQAYKLTDTTIPLLIAGTGSEYENLKKLIGDDERIKLIGYVSDKELVEYYAKAYAVIYVPYKEDYGLITIEAMQSKKTVITVEDAGGVLEFVRDKQTGLVSKPTVKELSKSIELLAKDKFLTHKLASKAKESVRDITWSNTVKKLLKEKSSITVISTYPIYPPRGGGQSRVYNLYKELSKHYDITIVSLVHSSLNPSNKLIAKNLYEIKIPKTKQHQSKEEELSKSIGIAATDLALLEYYNLTPEYIKTIKETSLSSDFVIMTSPYTYPLLKEHLKKNFIYESQNVEYLLKKSMLQKREYEQKLLDKLYEVEKNCCEDATIMTACSKDDINNFQTLYKLNKEIEFISNGVDLSSTPYYSKTRKQKRKRNSNYKDYKIALFVGSAHKPNIDATKEIIKLAQKRKDLYFIVIGGLDIYFQDISLDNIEFTGMIDEKEKENYMAIADIALNPMLTGSGTNLKMLDFMASGIPVLTTPIGARGLNIPLNYVAVADLKEWDLYIDNIDYFTDTKRARLFVEKYYDWRIISEKFYQKIAQKEVLI